MKSFLLPERWKREAFFIYATTDQSPLLRKILFSIVPLLLGVPTTQQQGTFRKQCLDTGIWFLPWIPQALLSESSLPRQSTKTPRKLLFLKEMLDAPQFLCYNVRANGRYRSFFYAQKTIASSYKWTPYRYWRKLANLSKTIVALGYENLSLGRHCQ